MNPRVSADFLEQERVMLGDQDFAREFEAEFSGGGASFFEEDAVRSVVGRYRELAPEEGRGWLVGFDPSFSVDPSAAAVVGRSVANPKQLVCARVERWLPRSGARKPRRKRHSVASRETVANAVLDAVARLSKTHGHAPVLTDQHTPSQVVEGLKSRGVARVQVRAWTPQSQTDGFRALRAHVYAGNITLPASDELVAELLRLTTRVQAGFGQVRIPRTATSHCDLAVALAMAVAEHDSRPTARPMRVSSVIGRIGRTTTRDEAAAVEALGDDIEARQAAMRMR
jgi:phage terminase large subunit-like protein